MTRDKVRIHLRRGMGREDDLNIIHGYNKPLSLNRLRQAKDEFALARIRRRETRLQEQQVPVRIHRYEEPLGAPGWKEEGGGARKDIIVPLRLRYREFMGKLGGWKPGEITQAEQAESLPSETRVIPDVGDQLEGELIETPFDQAPVGGWRGIPMQRGVEMPEEMVSVGRPPWMGALGSLEAVPNADPAYSPELVSAIGKQNPDGSIDYGWKMKVKKPGNVFFTYMIGFEDGTHATFTSNVARASANTPFDVYFHIPAAQYAQAAKKRVTHYAVTWYVTKGVLGLRRQQIGQYTKG